MGGWRRRNICHRECSGERLNLFFNFFFFGSAGEYFISPFGMSLGDGHRRDWGRWNL